MSPHGHPKDEHPRLAGRRAAPGLFDHPEVWLKMDALQPSGSFKLRGVGRLVQQSAADGAKAIVCASVILWCAEKATWMAGEGVQIFGGNGYINEYPLGRLWRDAKLYEIGAGTSEIRRMLIGRELFSETM